jgi:hypothetical protein
MDFDVGPYRLTLPGDATFPGQTERATPHWALPQFRLGPFDVHTSLLDGTLQDWRDHVEWTTKHQATIVPIEVNGIPGLTLPASERRLDYALQSPGQKLISIVAWSDHPARREQQRAVEAIVYTLCTPLRGLCPRVSSPR